MVFGLADSVFSSLLGSEGGTVFNGLSKEGNVVNGLGQLLFGISKKTLGVDNGFLTLDLRGGVGVSLSSRRGDFSLTDNEILVVLLISSGLFSLFLSNKVIDKSNNIIDDTFRSEVNL